MPDKMVKVTGLDLEFRLQGFTPDDPVIWVPGFYPITPEAADGANAKNRLMAQRLMQSEQAADKDRAHQLMVMEVKAKPGVAYTLRKAVCDAMQAVDYPDEAIDEKTGKPKRDSSEVAAHMGYLAIAFSRAPKKPGAYVKITEDDVKLIKRKALALGNQQMPPAVRSLLVEALDAALGADVKDRASVEYGCDEEGIAEEGATDETGSTED